MNTKTKILAIPFTVILLAGVTYAFNTNSRGSIIIDDHDEGTVLATYEIYPGDLVEKLNNNKDVILLDVRTEEEFEEIHLESALLLPVQELSQQSLNEIGLGQNMKDKEIYVYCRSGNRSKTAYDIMTSLGYTNVKSVAGGMIHWEEDEYPFTEVGEYVPTVQEPATATTQFVPQVTVDRPLHDFGVINQYGGIVETTFTISNTGDTTLALGDLSTSCSCASAEIGTTSLEPGESTMLTVYFDPDLHEEPLGVFKRTVFIPTNDPLTPELEVAVQVDIAEGQ